MNKLLMVNKLLMGKGPSNPPEHAESLSLRAQSLAGSQQYRHRSGQAASEQESDFPFSRSDPSPGLGEGCRRD